MRRNCFFEEATVGVVGHSLKLRYFKISLCNFDEILISTSNLTSFLFLGHEWDITFNSVPLFNEASFSANYAVRLVQYNFQPMSVFLFTTNDTQSNCAQG